MLTMWSLLPLSVFAEDDDAPSQMDRVGSISSSLNLSAGSTRSLVALGMVVLFVLIWFYYLKTKGK